MNDLNGIHALSHTTWNCKYHIVLAPKVTIHSREMKGHGKNTMLESVF